MSLHTTRLFLLEGTMERYAQKFQKDASHGVQCKGVISSCLFQCFCRSHFSLFCIQAAVRVTFRLEYLITEFRYAETFVGSLQYLSH
jgi:hypothetical protein